MNITCSAVLRYLTFSNYAMQRVEVDGKVVSQLCDEEGNLTAEQFEEAMRKQAKENLTSIFLQLLF